MGLRAVALLLLTLLCWPTTVRAGELILTGVYQGKNLYVQNPLSADRNRYCTQEVYVNNRIVASNPRTSAYTIDLSFLNFDDPIVVRILHMEGCEPKVINPQAIRNKGGFEFLFAQSDRNSLRWSTRGEKPNGKFFVERFEQGDWQTLETLDAKGDVDANSYSLVAEHFSGTNRYRLRYLAPDGSLHLSREIKFVSDSQPVTFFPVRVLDRITLSREVDYEIQDSNGKTRLKGRGDTIDVLSLEPGLYYLMMDNRRERFIKK